MLRNILKNQSKQIGKEMRNEIIKLTKKYENIINEDKKPKPKKLAKKVKNKINKYIKIFKEYEKPINKNNNVQNNDVDNNNENIPEIEFKLRSQAFKYKDKSYYADFDYLVDRNEFDTIEVRKFNGITFDMYVDITENPIKQILINDLIAMKGIKFDIAVKVKYYKWKQANNEFVLEKWLPWINTKNITITNAYEINMNSYHQYLLDKIEIQGEGSGWRIEGILSCNVNVSQYTPLRGSSYIDLPEQIKNKQCCINVKER